MTFTKIDPADLDSPRRELSNGGLKSVITLLVGWQIIFCGQKRATRKRYISPLFDGRGHPHPKDEWELLLPEIKACRLIRKRRHEAPNLDDADPNFGEEYDETKHGQMLKDELNISHLTVHQQNILRAVIVKYWRGSARRV